ncbi:MAG: hypothetical protein Q9M89_09405 [Persephonella sp.]|nr:hypothetical protein [Persephonella sp.]
MEQSAHLLTEVMCYGCFGPVKNPNIQSLEEIFEEHGFGDIYSKILTGFNAYNREFRGEDEKG